MAANPANNSGGGQAPPVNPILEPTPEPPVIGNITESLNDDQATLLAALVEINGQDAYDGMVAGVGRVNKSQWLALPAGMVIPRVDAAHVGQVVAHAGLTQRQWLQIYVLNRDICPVASEKVKFGLLRMEAVKSGWLTPGATYEVQYLPVPTDASLQSALSDDAAALRSAMDEARGIAFLLPLVAEHVFRTMGHHYISSDSTAYMDRYRLTFKSCLLPSYADFMSPEILFHTALHWVGPARAWEVLQAQKNTPHLPDAISIRATAAPAGTAIITTTAAVIRSLQSTALAEQFVTYGKFNFQMILDATDEIQKNPPRYHKTYFAYNLPMPSEEVTNTTKAATTEAIKFAPFAQAFIQTYLKDAQLAKAKALMKHAEQNPVQMRLARNLFNAFGKSKPKNVEELFQSSFSQEALEDN